jgi:beta-glucosidase
METLYEELARIVEPDGRVTYAAGYGQDETPDPELLAEARASAESARAAVVVVGLPGSFEEEGADRRHINLPRSHDAVVEAVLAVQPKTVVVLVNGSAVALPWVASAPAILEAWLAGQAGGGAIADVLTGRVNPSGKLAETFPGRLEDTPAFLSFPGDGMGAVQFAEGLFTGYRWYDARALQPLFPFGHGLSFTSFTYENLEIDQPALDDTDILSVSLRVTNTGSRTGKEVVQLYVRERQPRLPRPDKELKAFAKVDLEPGEGRIVQFSLDRRAFAFYDPQVRDWITTSGEFDILVGASSRDIRLMATVRLRSSHQLARQLTRLSSIGEWLADPQGSMELEPYMGAFRALVSNMDAAGEIHHFFLDMPLAKLVGLGVIEAEKLDQIILGHA